MSCKHEAKVETTRFKGITLYRIVCSKCGRRTIWAEYQRLAEKFFQDGEDWMLSKRGREQ